MLMKRGQRFKKILRYRRFQEMMALKRLKEKDEEYKEIHKLREENSKKILTYRIILKDRLYDGIEGNKLVIYNQYIEALKNDLEDLNRQLLIIQEQLRKLERDWISKSIEKKVMEKLIERIRDKENREFEKMLQKLNDELVIINREKVV